jgi:N-acetylglutamate synthase
MAILNFNIREMLPADLAPVVVFWNSIEGIGMSPDDNPEDLRKYLAHNPGLSFVAHAGADLVGAVLCGQDGRRGYINHLAVAPTFRKQGLGARLVNCCLEALSERDIHKCHIFVFCNNQPAIAFWMRTGWEKRTDLLVMSMRM